MRLDVPAGFPTANRRRFAPFPPRGPRGTSSPASKVLRGAATPCPPLAKLCCLALAIPPGTSVVSLPSAQTADQGPGVDHPVSLRDFSSGEDQGLPGSWATLVQLCPGLRPRRDRHARPLRRVSAAPRLNESEGYPRLREISGLHVRASLLAVYASWCGSPHRCTQDSLPAAGQLCRVGLATHRVTTKGFGDAKASHPPFPSLPGATSNHPPTRT
jgi:hypothetical protein